MPRRRNRRYDRREDSEWIGRFPPASRPREAKGGIKAHSKRGQFGESWWAKRWIAVLDSFNIGARLTRGRSYARKGQVLSISIESGLVAAKVQGSRPKPYEVAIKVTRLSVVDWGRIARAMSTQAVYAAKLLAGEMPQDLEQLFKAEELSLFPEKLADLSTSCSCPDWSNPCKHVAAVYYLLGEEFDRDPFLILKLRGLERAELVALMELVRESRDLQSIGATEETTPSQQPRVRSPRNQTASSELQDRNETVVEPREPLPVDLESFWSGGALPGDWVGEVTAPTFNAALPKRLGPFPFWRGVERFHEILERVYSRASPAGLEVLTGERQDESTQEY